MRKTVLQIPKNYIDEIVEKDIIAKAVPVSTNIQMKYLFVIWYNYIDRDGDGHLDCSFCLNNVLNNFRSLQQTIVDIYRENKKLGSL